MKKYYQQGETGVESFSAYQNSINQNTFIRLEAGILKKCFRMGGEILFLSHNPDLQQVLVFIGQKKRL